MDTREFCKKNGIFLKKLEWVGNAGKEWGPGANAWKVTLGHGRRSITVDFHTGSAWKKDEIDAATVLDSNKMAAGKYNSSKALKAWENLAEEAAKRYTKEHGGPGVVWHVWFPIAERREVARRLRDFFEEEAKLGNYDDLLFKKYRR